MRAEERRRETPLGVGAVRRPARRFTRPGPGRRRSGPPGRAPPPGGAGRPPVRTGRAGDHVPGRRRGRTQRRAWRAARTRRTAGKDGQRMIVTLTLNPSLDRTIEVERLVRGTMTRATSARLDPGGKGVNVSRAPLANGVPSGARGPRGGAGREHA